MKIQVRIPPEEVIAAIKSWRDRNGQTININKMASSHLLNAIHMIERNRYQQVVDAAARVAMNPLDDDDNPIQYYLQWPVSYFALCREAERRGLIMRAPAPEESKALARRKK